MNRRRSARASGVKLKWSLTMGGSVQTQAGEDIDSLIKASLGVGGLPLKRSQRRSTKVLQADGILHATDSVGTRPSKAAESDDSNSKRPPKLKKKQPIRGAPPQSADGSLHPNCTNSVRTAPRAARVIDFDENTSGAAHHRANATSHQTESSPPHLRYRYLSEEEELGLNDIDLDHCSYAVSTHDESPSPKSAAEESQDSEQQKKNVCTSVQRERSCSAGTKCNTLIEQCDPNANNNTVEAATTAQNEGAAVHRDDTASKAGNNATETEHTVLTKLLELPLGEILPLSVARQVIQNNLRDEQSNNVPNISGDISRKAVTDLQQLLLNRVSETPPLSPQIAQLSRPNTPISPAEKHTPPRTTSTSQTASKLRYRWRQPKAKSSPPSTSMYRSKSERCKVLCNLPNETTLSNGSGAPEDAVENSTTVTKVSPLNLAATYSEFCSPAQIETKGMPNNVVQPTLHARSTARTADVSASISSGNVKPLRRGLKPPQSAQSSGMRGPIATESIGENVRDDGKLKLASPPLPHKRKHCQRAQVEQAAASSAPNTTKTHPTPTTTDVRFADVLQALPDTLLDSLKRSSACDKQSSEARSATASSDGAGVKKSQKNNNDRDKPRPHLQSITAPNDCAGSAAAGQAQSESRKSDQDAKTDFVTPTVQTKSCSKTSQFVRSENENSTPVLDIHHTIPLTQEQEVRPCVPGSSVSAPVLDTVGGVADMNSTPHNVVHNKSQSVVESPQRKWKSYLFDDAPSPPKLSRHETDDVPHAAVAPALSQRACKVLFPGQRREKKPRFAPVVPHIFSRRGARLQAAAAAVNASKVPKVPQVAQVPQVLIGAKRKGPAFERVYRVGFTGH